MYSRICANVCAPGTCATQGDSRRMALEAVGGSAACGHAQPRVARQGCPTLRGRPGAAGARAGKQAIEVVRGGGEYVAVRRVRASVHQDRHVGQLALPEILDHACRLRVAAHQLQRHARRADRCQRRVVEVTGYSRTLPRRHHGQCRQDLGLETSAAGRLGQALGASSRQQTPERPF
eukprot:scaffold4267_cov124-Isochrysis_galbana.AAC.1